MALQKHIAVGVVQQLCASVGRFISDALTKARHGNHTRRRYCTPVDHVSEIGCVLPGTTVGPGTYRVDRNSVATKSRHPTP